jgi:hypothetical protein
MSSIICTLTKYYQDDQIKKCEMGGACSAYGDVKNVYGRPRRRWKDKIKMDLRDMGLAWRVWIGFTWLRTGTGGWLL